NGAITPPPHTGPGEVAIETINSGNLQPETAFGYNLGADFAFKDNATFATADVYLTNLYGQFLDESYPHGLCPVSAGCHPNTPLFFNQYINLSNARYEGIEFGIKHVPPAGFGFSLQGSTQRGYPYDLPPLFYCAFKATAKYPCVPAHYNTNLNILPGQNYYGEYIDNTGSTTAGVSNQSVPYLQGNAEISYRLRNGAFALIGETLYGKNNSLNRPPFGVAYASIAYPLNGAVALQISGYNIFNAYSGLFPVYGGGVTVPLANELQAGTIGNVLGPARYLFQITKALGQAGVPAGTP
ncbi:MAG: TonB-dependent receptor, partial [Candidatus Eremiobacteraeota bacterium]|nr:TonB-dependent receptor [Candidatus Eremiobacteraeota bacterium]